MLENKNIIKLIDFFKTGTLTIKFKNKKIVDIKYMNEVTAKDIENIIKKWYNELSVKVDRFVLESSNRINLSTTSNIIEYK